MEISDTNEKEEELQNKEDKGDTPEPEGGFQMKVIFTIFGIGSLLAWNAILSDLGFFINFQGEFDPSTSFSFLNFALNIVFQFIMICKKQLISYRVQLIFGLLASVVTIVFLPIIVISFEKNSTTGFIFTALVILFQGLVNAFCCSGFYGLTSFFPMEMIIALSTGQGISGILMNIIQYIVLASVNTGDGDNDAKYGAIIFFSISGLILLVCFVILLFAFKSEYFKYYLSQTKDFSQSEGNVEKVKEGPITRNTGDEDDDLMESGKESLNNKEVSFMQLFKLLIDIDLLSCYIYIITFALFPSCSISQRLFEFGKYRQCTIITIYNVCDTIGRSIVSAIKPTKILSYIVILGRTILLFTFIFVFYCDQKLGMSPNLSSILLIINVSALALTNGVGTSLCFGLAPSLVPDKLKGRAGSSVGFFNIFGIFIGTCVAFLTMFIMGKIGKYE
jgi:equilibrative nucleoside transporter 1/2/3